MTEWNKHVLVITTNLTIGNALAAKIDPDTGGDKTFRDDKYGVRLRAIGSTGPATAWAASVPLRQAGYDAVVEFQGAGPYPILNARGITDAMVAAGKPAMTLQAGDRLTLDGTLPAFIAANGYEIIPWGAA